MKNRAEKHWGHEDILEQNRSFVFKKSFIKKGECCCLQYHDRKLETIYVLDGKLEVFVGDFKDNLDTNIYEKGSFLVFPAKKIHRICGETDCTYLEISTNFPNDLVKLEENFKKK